MTVKPVKQIKEDPKPKEGFSGIARSVECFYNQGHCNFRVVTLTIENSLVVNIEYSDPYAHFEVITKMQSKMNDAILNLNNHWDNGKTISK